MSELQTIMRSHKIRSINWYCIVLIRWTFGCTYSTKYCPWNSKPQLHVYLIMTKLLSALSILVKHVLTKLKTCPHNLFTPILLQRNRLNLYFITFIISNWMFLKPYTIYAIVRNLYKRNSHNQFHVLTLFGCCWRKVIIIFEQSVCVRTLHTPHT